MLEFKTWLYDDNTEEEYEVLIQVTHYSAGSAATYYDPPEYSELEYGVYLEGSSENIYNKLTEKQQGELDDRVYDYVEDYYSSYYDGDY